MNVCPQIQMIIDEHQKECGWCKALNDLSNSAEWLAATFCVSSGVPFDDELRAMIDGNPLAIAWKSDVDEATRKKATIANIIQYFNSKRRG